MQANNIEQRRYLFVRFDFRTNHLKSSKGWAKLKVPIPQILRMRSEKREKSHEVSLARSTYDPSKLINFIVQKSKVAKIANTREIHPEMAALVFSTPGSVECAPPVHLVVHAYTILLVVRRRAEAEGPCSRACQQDG